MIASDKMFVLTLYYRTYVSIAKNVEIFFFLSISLPFSLFIRSLAMHSNQLNKSIIATKIIPPKTTSSTSLPSLIVSLQNEWDALMLETFNLKQQLDSVRNLLFSKPLTELINLHRHHHHLLLQRLDKNLLNLFINTMLHVESLLG